MWVRDRGGHAGARRGGACARLRPSGFTLKSGYRPMGCSEAEGVWTEGAPGGGLRRRPVPKSEYRAE
jgi:hypothetical protein